MLHKRNNSAIVLLVLLSLLFSQRLPAQEYPVLQYTETSGLPSNMVYNVYRDSKGFLWIATDKGVARYDGISFKKFTTADGLVCDEVFQFREDCEQRLWLGSYTGALMYYKNGHFYSAKNTPFLRVELKAAIPRDILIESDSSVTISFTKQRTILNIKGEQCKVYSLPENLSVEEIEVISKTNDSLFQVVYWDKKIELNIFTGQYSVTKFDKPVYFSSAQNQKHYFDAQTIYSFSFQPQKTWSSSVRYTGYNHPTSDIVIYHIYFNGKDYLAAGEQGVFINDKVALLEGKRLSALTQDVNGDYWISSLGEGLFKVGKNFYNRQFKLDIPGIVTYCNTWNGTLYLATDQRRLYRMEGNKMKEVLDFKMNKADRSMGYHTDCGRYGNTLYCIGGDGNFYTYDMQRRQSRKYDICAPLLNRYNAEISVARKTFISDKYLYLMSSGRIDRIATGVFDNRPLDFKRIEDNIPHIYTTANDTPDHLWYFRKGGICKIEEEKIVPHPEFDAAPYKWMHAQDGYLIACTPSNKLLLYEGYHQSRKVDSFVSRQNIWDKIYPIDKQRMLLVSGAFYYTLSLRDHKPGTLRPAIVENNFIPSNADYFYTLEDTCFFFKDGMMTAIQKQEIFVKAPKPVLYFAEAATKDSTYLLRQKDHSLRFPYKSASNIHLSFDVLGFNASGVHYEYCIVQDKQTLVLWQELGDNELNLLLPDYGTIRVLVRAVTLGGVFSDTKELFIDIEKPWWAKWWGALLMSFVFLLMSGSLVYFFLRRMFRRREKENAAKAKMMHSEFKALNAMMNPHFIFNTINNIQGFINSDDKVSANQYIRTFSDLVRQNMQNVARGLVSLHEEMIVVERYLKLEQLRHSCINYRIDIDDEVDTEAVMIPPLLIQPLVENCIKHGILPAPKADTLIVVHITEQEDILTIEVTDNGIGFKASHVSGEDHLSFALSAIRQRIENMGLTHNIHMSFDIKAIGPNGHETGTRATLRIYPQ